MSSMFLVTYIALWVIVSVLSVGVFALYHHFGEMYLNSRDGRANQGPELQKPLRRVHVAATSGVKVDLPASGIPSLVLFADTNCRLCENLIPDLGRLGRERPDVSFSIVCGGSEGSVRKWAHEIPVDVSVVADPGQVLTTRYRIGVTPFAVAVGASGLVKGKGIVNDADGLSYFLDAAIAEPEQLTGSALNGG